MNPSIADHFQIADQDHQLDVCRLKISALEEKLALLREELENKTIECENTLEWSSSQTEALDEISDYLSQLNRETGFEFDMDKLPMFSQWLEWRPQMSLRDIKFSEATPEQFREFWEGEGWRLSIGQVGGHAVRATNDDYEIYVYTYGSFSLDWEMHETWPKIQCATFGEAIDAANELANTRICGGWE